MSRSRLHIFIKWVIIVTVTVSLNSIVAKCFKLNKLPTHITRKATIRKMAKSMNKTTRKMKYDYFPLFATPNPKQEVLSTVDDKTYKSALVRSAACFVTSCVFGIVLFLFQGFDFAEQFFAGYLVEESLSVDNLLIFILLFDYFKIPEQYQNRILNWGIIGAIIMRGIMISLGVVALQSYRGVLLIFAGLLIYSSCSILYENIFNQESVEESDLSNNWIVNFSKSTFRATDQFDTDRFFIIENGMKMATPMFLCLIAIELSDVVFAVDSVPAVFGVTENPFIVYSSNIFAILSLRSLYSVLSKAVSSLKYLESSVGIVLGFIGFKLIAEFYGFCVSTTLSLGVVMTTLFSGVILSLYLNTDEEMNKNDVLLDDENEANQS